MRHLLSVLFTLVLLLPAVRPAAAASGDAVRGTGGAVASGDRFATEAGLAILAAGGNAVDAAVATALVLAVTFPEAGNLGGGGFALVKIGDEVTALDFREVAPAGATHDMFVDADGVPVSGKSLIGPLAAGVPGSPQGLYALHQRHGVLPWKQIVEPARRLAAEGFAVSRNLHDSLEDDRDLLSRFPETAAVWLPDGAPPPVGSIQRLPDLAATLAAYAEHGPQAITTGEVAAAVEAVSRRHGGVLTAADLGAYQPQWRTPVRFEGFGWQIAAMPLPSSGGAIFGETIGLLERLGWQAQPRFGAERAHLMVESWRRAYADRFQMGDQSTARATPQDVLAAAWLDRQAAAISPTRAAVSVELEPYPGKSAGTPPHESTDTTHLSVVDAAGNLVALTTTINGLYGCGLYVPGAGFFLNNEMDDFAAAPGRPNLFGLVQGETNAVRPGKRMLSSMSPTIAWRNDGHGSEALALGGRGGSMIPTNTLQVLLNVIVDGDELQAAVNRPRIHHQWLPDYIRAEPDALAPETRAVLEARGHRIETSRATAKVQAVRTNADGTVEAAAEVRGSGSAGVVQPLEGVGLGDRRAVPPPAAAPTPPS
jgi:gamma-glutamyltranspeptidase/glutathione hydrolase